MVPRMRWSDTGGNNPQLLDQLPDLAHGRLVTVRQAAVGPCVSTLALAIASTMPTFRARSQRDLPTLPAEPELPR